MLVDDAPGVDLNDVITGKIKVVIKVIEEGKRITVAEEIVLIEDRDEQEHSSSMPQSPARWTTKRMFSKGSVRL